MNTATAKTTRRSRWHQLALAATFGALAGLPAASVADDTEIYLGVDSLNEGVRPNIMFILDTSGSMSATVTGTGMDRLDNMKQALNTIVTNANNVNVGLMRFHDPGGPVLFPVSYIDEDVSVVEDAQSAGVDVNTRIDLVTDDAEENAAGDVDLFSSALDVVELSALTPGGGGSFERQVEANNEDAEMYISNGNVVLNGNTLGVAYDDGEPQVVGLRFDNIGIPPGAVINSADLLFTAKENDADTGFTLRIYGEATDDAQPFTSTAYDFWPDAVNYRNWTTSPSIYVDWAPPAWTSNQKYATPDIKTLVQAAVNRPGWTAGNAMAFYVYNVSFNGSNARRRATYSHESDSAKAPVLRISYSSATAVGKQTVGLRFRNVGVPRGATVNSARIEFRATVDTADVANLVIRGQDTGDAATFGDSATAKVNNTGQRPRTTASVPWSPGAWATGDVQQTSDLTAVVQEIVNRGDWCGNNSMAFFIDELVATTDMGPRIADSFDSNPTNAPILRIDFDEENLPADACIDQFVQRSVAASSDDAEETESTGAINLTSSDLDLEDGKLVGLRFTDLPVNQGQEILEAKLTLVSDNNDTGATTLVIRGHAVDDSDEFESATKNLSNRATTTAAVTWSPTDWTNETPYTAPDLKTVIQEVVNRGGWTPGGALSLLIEHTGGPNRRAETYDQNPITSAVLNIKVRGQLSTGGSGVKTVRHALKEIIDNLDHRGHTPIVDTLYEAVQYFRGGPVHWGAMRGHDRDGTFNPNPNADSTNAGVRANTRISHAASWTGGTITKPAGCTDENLNDPDCKTEKISGATAGAVPQSSASYISPITTECQANYVILLTDGQANHNHSADLIKSLTGVTSCTETNAAEACGKDLAKWMNDTDQSTLGGDQGIVLYTIGFNFSSDWLKELAQLGGGSFYTANTAAELADQITAIFTDILNRTTSFAAPSLSVNAFNRLFHRNDVYFSLFKPSATVRWDGNVKKYQLCDDTTTGCLLGEVLDSNGDPAINSDPTAGDVGRIKDVAKSFWSTEVDGAEIKEGGAGFEIPAPGARKVYAFTGTTPPSTELLTTAANQMLDVGGDGILDGLLGTENARRQRTQQLFGDPTFTTNDTERADLIEWLRGADVDQVEEIKELADAGRRYAFNDPLHSSPVAVTFGGTGTDPVIKLFVGTNDGALRMLNAKTGAEEWAFFPQTTLEMQAMLRANNKTDHAYGIDGTPTAWINDRNNDGVIDPGSDTDGNGTIDEDEGDFVRIFVGMRRGGDHVFAIDVTPTQILTNPEEIDKIQPTLLWRIDGGNGDYVRLGQTWSRPRLAKLRFGTGTAGQTVERRVLIFAGGYDTLWDTSFGAQANGNAIYIVDPSDGSVLYVISGSTHGVSNQQLVSDMLYPIPSDVAMVDNNADGSVDRLFFGDLHGQVWRVDLAPDLAAGSATIKAVVGKLAEVSGTVDDADKRRIFYPPDVVRVPSSATGSTGLHDLVVVTTGNRAHPLDENVKDRIYAFRDFNVNAMVDADDNGIADSASFPTLQGPIANPSTTGDLLDVTDTLDFTDAANLTDLKSSSGWYIDLEETGEKSLAGPVILAGQLFVTTYLPEGVVNVTSCSLQEGTGRLYGLNVLTGEPLKNWDGAGDSTTLTKSDRVYALGGGIPSQAVPIFQEEGITLLVGGGGGATAVDPGIQLPRVRTYWYQEEGG